VARAQGNQRIEIAGLWNDSDTREGALHAGRFVVERDSQSAIENKNLVTMQLATELRSHN
jgi:hypothetical protein